MVLCICQRDDGKLDDLLKEVTETEVPSDAPKAPPQDEIEIEGEDVLLPSQRGKYTLVTYCNMYKKTSFYLLSLLVETNKQKRI